MKKQNPPETARKPGQRISKFTALRSELLADENLGEWFNITEDLGADGKPEAYFAELARSITAGNRAAFRPKGWFEARADGKQVWARSVPVSARPADTEAAAAAK
jgi:hypothetical protein